MIQGFRVWVEGSVGEGHSGRTLGGASRAGAFSK